MYKEKENNLGRNPKPRKKYESIELGRLCFHTDKGWSEESLRCWPQEGKNNHKWNLAKHGRRLKKKEKRKGRGGSFSNGRDERRLQKRKKSRNDDNVLSLFAV